MRGARSLSSVHALCPLSYASIEYDPSCPLPIAYATHQPHQPLPSACHILIISRRHLPSPTTWSALLPHSPDYGGLTSFTTAAVSSTVLTATEAPQNPTHPGRHYQPPPRTHTHPHAATHSSNVNVPQNPAHPHRTEPNRAEPKRRTTLHYTTAHVHSTSARPGLRQCALVRNPTWAQ